METSLLGSWKANTSVMDSNQISAYALAKSGSEMSGSLSISNANLILTNGNIIATDGSTTIYSTNSYVQGKSLVGYSPIGTGAFGYVFIGLNINNNPKTAKLSGDLTKLNEKYIGKLFSYALEDYQTTHSLSIISVDTATNVVTFKDDLDSAMLAKLSSYTEQQFEEIYKTDENALYTADDILLGDHQLRYSNCNHAEGGSTRAIGQFSHAEGRLTIAEGNYSHAEGHDTYAAAGAHAEGFICKAYGLKSHVEGMQTTTYSVAEAAHAEGYQTSAFSNHSHSEGYKTCAIGQGSHAEGSECSAIGNYSHAEGSGSVANGKCSYSSGNQTKALGEYSRAIGNQSYADENAQYSIACGGNAISKNKFQFVWNGKTATKYFGGGSNYLSSTFSINPDDGLNGFFIGNNTLSTILYDIVSNAKKQAKDEAKEEILSELLYDGNSNMFATTNGKTYDYIRDLSSNEYNFRATHSSILGVLTDINWLCDKIKILQNNGNTNGAFNGAKRLSSVNLEYVEVLSNYAFENTGLTGIYCPNVTKIGSAVFQRNIQLSIVNLPKVEIFNGGYQFDTCSNLLSIIIPNATTLSTYGTFKGLSNIELISFADRDVEKYPNIPVCNNFTSYINATKNYKIVVPDSMYDTWIQTAPWSNTAIKSHIVKASEV